MNALPNSKITLLIVDDLALLRTAWKSLFKSSEEYIIVAEAKNGLEAVQYCERRSVDVVLMDITMPLMNGIEATRIISKLENAPKIIALSMHSEIEYLEKMFEAGAKSYITKDASFTELCIAIDTVMNNEIYVGSHFKYKR